MQAENIPPQLDKAECERHLRGLNSYNREIREAGLRQITALPPELLLQLMREGSRYYGKRYRLSSCVELILLVASLPIGLWLFVAFGMSINLFGWLLLLVAFSAIAWHICTVPWRMYRALVGVLEQTEDLNLVGPAISMYVRPDALGRTRIVLGNTLRRLLPQLRSTHANLLTADQKHDLLRLLLGTSSENEVEKSVALHVMLQALKALEQVGDESAIPAVQKLALSTININRQLRQAAVECLEYLRINAGRNREMQTLLRASSASNTAPDTLLRPASSSEDTASEHLLRPSA